MPADADAVLDLLCRTAEAIGAALDETTDWGEAGTRPGQHHSDLAADAVAVDLLVGAGFGVLSEESGRHRPDRAVTVVVDPLDGSTNASRRMAAWATSLCAVDDAGPWVALVVDLRHGTQWTAVRGGGARRDGRPIRASAVDDPAGAIVGLNGVPHRHGGWAQYRAFGAAALDLCAVADGTFDGFVDCTDDELAPWDYLGGLLVCAESGAEVVDARGRDLVELDHDARRIPVAAGSAALHRHLHRWRRETLP